MGYKSLLMMFLRGATLGSKFILVMLLAKYASFETLANYSLLTITISFLLYLLGFDFYTFSSREIIQQGFSKSGQLLYNQFLFYFLMYLLAVPIVFGINYFHILNVGLLFYFVLITEHLAQECMRIIVINNNPFKANFQLFLRSSFWIYIYILYSYYSGSYDLDKLLLFWFISNVFAILYSLSEFQIVDKNNIFIIKTKWIAYGLKIAIPLLITTLMLRGVYFSDRYFLKYTSTTEELAVYSFYSNMANALIAFIDASVIMVFYPKIIEAFKKGNKREYNDTLKKFKKSLLKIGVFIFSVLSLIIPFICFLLGKNEYLHLIVIFYLLLISSFIYSYGLIYHYELYARKQDKKLLVCTGFCFISGLSLQYILGIYLGGVGIAIAMLTVSCLLMITKSRCIKLIKQREDSITY